MKCYICSSESTIGSTNFVEFVCLDCEKKFIDHDEKCGALKKEYYDNHALCPKCFSSSHSSTLVAYIFYSERPEEYKDLNKCVCEGCGDIHTAHDRIPLNKI